MSLVMSRAPSGTEPSQPKRHLTPRQVEIFWHAAQGRSQGEIATALGISEFTVKGQIWKAYIRLGVHTLPEVLIALGWLHLPASPEPDPAAPSALARIRAVLDECEA